MSFEAAIVSCLAELPDDPRQPNLTKKSIKIHSVHMYCNEAIADTSAKVEAQRAMHATYSESYVGVLDSAENLLSHKVGSCALVFSCDNITAYYLGEQIITGWVTNMVLPTVFELGTFCFIRAEDTLPEIKQTLQSTRNYVNNLECKMASMIREFGILVAENENLRAEVDSVAARLRDMNKISDEKTQNYEKVSAKLAKTREQADNYCALITALKCEIAKLRGKPDVLCGGQHILCAENNKIAESQITKVTKITTASNKTIASIAECFAMIATFDRATLKNRAQRDALLAKKADPVSAEDGN